MGIIDYLFWGFITVGIIYCCLALVACVRYHIGDLVERAFITEILPGMGLAIFISIIIPAIIFVQHIVGNVYLTVLPSWL